MRRYLSEIVIILMAGVMLSACGNTDSKVDQVIQSQMQEADNKNSKSEQAVETKEDKISETIEIAQSEVVEDDDIEENSNVDVDVDVDAEVDVDLTKLSSTMVYSEVYNMMYIPENYIGKTVKMSGMFVTYTNQDQSQFYPAVIIADATACCSQGLEFVLEGNPSYPEGYPEMETDITVIGTFETYLEDGNTFCRLQNAKIE